MPVKAIVAGRNNYKLQLHGNTIRTRVRVKRIAAQKVCLQNSKLAQTAPLYEKVTCLAVMTTDRRRRCGKSS